MKEKSLGNFPYHLTSCKQQPFTHRAEDSARYTSFHLRCCRVRCMARRSLVRRRVLSGLMQCRTRCMCYEKLCDKLPA